MVDEAEDPTGAIEHKGGLKRPKIVVVENPMFLLHLNDTIINQMREHTGFDFEFIAYGPAQRLFRPLHPCVKQDMKLDAIRQYIMDPSNKIAGVLTGQGDHEAYGFTLTKDLRMHGYKGPIVMQTLGQTAYENEAKPIADAGALGPYPKDLVYMNDPTNPPLRAMKAAIAAQAPSPEIE